MIIEGFVPVIILDSKDYYGSKKQERFIDNVENLFLGDLFSSEELALNYFNIKEDPTFKGIAKIKIEIDL